MPKHLTTNDFIIRAQEMHGELYDYSQVVYDNMHTKVKIIDPDYGEFWQSPMGHLQGQGHPKRGKLKAAKSRDCVWLARWINPIFLHRYHHQEAALADYSQGSVRDFWAVLIRRCLAQPAA